MISNFDQRVKNFLKNRLAVKYQSSSANVFHCCAHKTASQWVRRILSDRKTFLYCGLVHKNPEVNNSGNVDTRKMREKVFNAPFPKRSILSPLYISYGSFVEIPKPYCYKAVYVMRDPRDIICSYYFSVKYSHSPMGVVLKMRELLNEVPVSQGLIHVMEHLDDYGTFWALNSWIDAPQKDANIMLVRFEDLTSEKQDQVVRSIFNHCDIRLPDNILIELLNELNFQKLSGRKKGIEDPTSHYRKGVSGDWRNYFDSEVEGVFRRVTGDLVKVLGY
jgi:hypothetical protein